MKKISKKHNLNSKENASRIGILEWFHKNDFEHVKNTIKDLHSLGITELRTGLSWADFKDNGGAEWYDWLFQKLSKYFHILPCLVYTPPSLGLTPNTMSPPKDPKMFAEFTDHVLKRYGKYFDYIELWNEPNNLTFYNVQMDPNWDIFTSMISMAASEAKNAGKKTVLGGLSPIDPFWLSNMASRNLLQNIDVVGVHGYPKTYDNVWEGWPSEIKKIRDVLNFYSIAADIWITETGYSTWKYDEQNQIIRFIDALKAPVNKIYWSSLFDLSPSRPTIRGFHVDEREYHFGIKRSNGISKMLFRALNQYAPENIENEKLFSHPIHLKNQHRKGVLITGGAGFIGTNVANRLLENGERVIVYDNLSRPGVENNLKWLQSQYPNVEVMIADVKDSYSLKKAVNEASHVFHFAAQVAVTTSLVYPEFDHEVNVGGTINVLEAIRTSAHKPSLIFTSTNKVYGDLSGLEIRNNDTRYSPVDSVYARNGIDEKYPLSFHSPYGSSKGSADQYIIDYARSFGLNNVVFRMSCIYGPHQFGTEDQGWVAHFIRQSIQNKKIILYGDGKQVRDILYIEDLVDAFLLARQNILHISGEAFNIGGGPENSVSLLELLHYMSRLDHLNIQIDFDKWRTGDQKYYVSDTRKFKNMTGWQPKTSYMEGITKLYNWIHQMQEELALVEA